jgi:FkbM family methyltransferase
MFFVMGSRLKAVARRFGLDIRLVRNINRSNALSWKEKQDQMWTPFLSHLDIRTVIDVGANAGQFAELINRHCPNARIISFEPLESCHEELLSVLGNIPGSQVIKKAAGENPGLSSINESEFSPCSSMLPGSNLLGEDYSNAAITSPVEIEIVRLDDELRIEELARDILVKFDVQGFEIPAMHGAMQLLSQARVVVCEVCFFRKLYQGQPLFHEIYEELRMHGYTYMGNVEQAHRKSDGRIVEADAIFERIID